jgi:hypothetical protein
MSALTARHFTYWTMSYDIVLAPGDEDGDELQPAEQVEAAERSEA